ncbi:MAG: hypothetical protein FJX72_15110, partial [Armatimonadetes bacterium]|nr:hypothetical protein [Armatimonadota bacterium]
MATYAIGPDRIVSELAMPTATIAVAKGDLSDARLTEIGADLARGGSLIVIGSECIPGLRAHWVDAQPCAAVRHRSVGDLSPAPDVAWAETPCRALCVRPDRVHTYFGADEMPRAEIVPLVEAVGTDGEACAYSALWVKHYAPSLVGGRYDGANLYLFAFDDPLAAASLDQWQSVVNVLAAHAASGVAFTRVRADRALYRPCESGSVRLGIANRSPHIASLRMEMTLHAPDGSTAGSRAIRRCLNAGERIEAPWEFECAEQEGLWRVAAELYLEDRFTYGYEREACSVLVERTECAFVVAASPTGPTQPRLDGRSFAVGDCDGFLAGTHYYPSSSWWDWAWRDFRPERADRDIEEMARHGYRFARVWIDPELDEQALRGFEAWLHLSAARGIVSIVCVFTQWSRTLAYPDESGVMVSFEFATTRDFNVYSVQLKNVEHQKRYLGVLARRWGRLPNVIWNLANEVFIVDPSPEQLDPAYFGDVEPKTGPLAGAAYMNRWADLLTETLRAEGAMQPVLRGYGFVNGGDCYLQNRTGAMLLWHHYESAERAGPCLAFASPGTLAKPLIMEEFGIPTLDEEERLERYEGIACWSVAMGAAGACAYEWGVSWLAPELPFTATPLRDASLGGEPDPRWMDGQVQYSASWPIGSMGLCPWAASFAYGSNLPCTPFAAPAGAALGSVARFCSDIGPPPGATDIPSPSLRGEGHAPAIPSPSLRGEGHAPAIPSPRLRGEGQGEGQAARGAEAVG